MLSCVSCSQRTFKQPSATAALLKANPGGKGNGYGCWLLSLKGKRGARINRRLAEFSRLRRRQNRSFEYNPRARWQDEKRPKRAASSAQCYYATGGDNQMWRRSAKPVESTKVKSVSKIYLLRPDKKKTRRWASFVVVVSSTLQSLSPSLSCLSLLLNSWTPPCEL